MTRPNSARLVPFLVLLFLAACAAVDRTAVTPPRETVDTPRLEETDSDPTVRESGTSQSLQSRPARVSSDAIAAETAAQAAESSEPFPPLPQLPPQRNDPPPRMIFDNDPINPFIDTRDDNLSTFALDVDTGSYTLVRSYLFDQGTRPPAEAIRVEEFINYFDHEYASPDEATFAVHVEGAAAPYGESDAYHLVRIGVQGYEVPDVERPSALLIFVIDVSGSMDMDNRLGLVKESLRLLVEVLRPDDRIGIVTYGSRAATLLDPTPIADGSAVLEAISALTTSGSTNVEEGIALGYRMADRYRLEGDIARLIVLSDGVANVGNTTSDAILENARRGVSLSTFGFGMGNYNDALMESLANQGDGTYAYIDTLREAQRVFVNDLTGTLVTIAKDAKIQVEFNPAIVERYRLIGYENRDIADEDFRNDQVDAGEIGAGHSATALYEIRLAAEAAPLETALTVWLRWEDPETGEIEELSTVTRPADFAADLAETSRTFRLAAVVAEVAEILRESYWARESDIVDVWIDAREVGELFPARGTVAEFVQLAESAAGNEP